jgi:hypothetical protein
MLTPVLWRLNVDLWKLKLELWKLAASCVGLP